MKPFPNFPELLKSLIESRGWSQREFALRLGMHKHTIRQWCNGSTSPPGFRIVRIAAALGVLPERLASPDPAPDKPDPQRVPRITRAKSLRSLMIRFGVRHASRDLFRDLASARTGYLQEIKRTHPDVTGSPDSAAAARVNTDWDRLVELCRARGVTL